MPESGQCYSLFSEVRALDVEWLWYPFIPCGKITLLQGDPGGGKSTLVMDIIGKLTTGRKLPDGRILAPMNVLYQCSEDGLADTIKPRLETAGADCKRVGYISEDLFGLTLDDEKVRNAIVQMSAHLLVIDPFQAYLGDTDLSSATGMRRLLRRLSMWAASTNCAILLVGHLTKKNSSNELYRGLGSVDLVAAARSVIQVDRDGENDEIRIIKHVKSSLTPRGSDVPFTINHRGGIRWLEIGERLETSEIETGNPESDGRSKTKQEFAAELISELLSNGPAEASGVMQKLEDAGIGTRTVKIAKKALAIVSKRKNDKWYWHLPAADDINVQREKENE